MTLRTSLFGVMPIVIPFQKALGSPVLMASGIILVSGAMSEGASPFPLKIFAKKFKSTQLLENASVTHHI